MGVSSFSSFDGPDLLAFVVCAGIGYVIGSLIPSGAASIYTTILVAYHLFLAWLILRVRGDSDQGDKRAGISLPIVHTLLTHAACLVVILAPVAAALHSMPFLTHPATAAADPADPEAAMLQMENVKHGLRLIKGLCCAIAAFAVFERRWLFSSEASEAPRPQPAPSPVVSAVRATGDDTVEWERYLAEHRQSFAPGTSIKAEYEKWLVARYGGQPSAPPSTTMD
jgi:hypothetical protein